MGSLLILVIKLFSIKDGDIGFFYENSNICTIIVDLRILKEIQFN